MKEVEVVGNDDQGYSFVAPDAAGPFNLIDGVVVRVVSLPPDDEVRVGDEGKIRIYREVGYQIMFPFDNVGTTQMILGRSKRRLAGARFLVLDKKEPRINARRF